MIQVGTGGWGAEWCASFLPRNVEEGIIEVVAAVDENPHALVNARNHLGLSPAQCYTDLRRALGECPADFCAVVVPPAFHEAVIEEALSHGLHILSEKPIADTLEGACRIASKVKRAGKKMAVTMSHRFDQDKSALRRELRARTHGPLDYLSMRYSSDYRQFGSWGEFRHEMQDPLMIEGAVHHLDILADLAGSPCETVYAETWTPAWGEFGGHAQGLVMLRFENGVRAVYEGANCNAAGLSTWTNEYIRAECEGGTLVLSGRALERFEPLPHDAPKFRPEGSGNAIPLDEQPKWANSWLIEQFAQWLNGGPTMETNVEDNLQSVALVFAAIESSRTGQPVKVQELLQMARARVEQAK